MKKHYLFVLFALALTVFQTSCSKSDDDYENDTPELILVDDEPGKIAGLGDVGGELEGPMFKLPSGISSVGEIKGSDLDLNKVVSNRIGQSKTRSLNDQAARANFFALAGTFGADSIKGSGYLVSVAITLRNDNNDDVQVAFPAGTILKSRSGKFQNGILVKKTTFLIPKNSQKRVHLFMYCGNYSRHASSPSEIYDWSVITTSRSLHNLFDLLIDKKINIEQYLSSRSEMEKYANIVNKIQSIIWQITDWEHGLTESDKKYLEALPIE